MMRTLTILFLCSGLAVASPFMSGTRNAFRKWVHRILVEEPPAATGQGYVVAANGTVGSAGTIGAPWSWEYAKTQQVWRSADLMIFRDGTFNGNVREFFNLGKVTIEYTGGAPLVFPISKDGTNTFTIDNPVDPPAVQGEQYVNVVTLQKP